MVNTHHIKKTGGCAHPFAPPKISVLRHAFIRVDGVAPELACCGKVIRRYARDQHGAPLLIKPEQFRMLPHVGGIVRDIDRNIAYHGNAALRRRISKRIPLPEKQILYKDMVLYLVRKAHAICFYRFGLTHPDILVPFVPRTH